MRNVIAMSLWGSDAIYTQGAIVNAELRSRFYPDWELRIWHKDVLSSVCVRLEDLGVILHEAPFIMSGMFWRFLVNDLEGVDRYVIRDADSRFNAREVSAVNDWIKSGLDFHVMRDHPHHSQLVMGGLFGCRGGVIKNMEDLIVDYKESTVPSNRRDHIYGHDQRFLARVIWPLVKHSVLQHDSCTARHFPGSVPFPCDFGGRIKHEDWRFCGEIFLEDNKPHLRGWQERINCMYQ